MNEVQDNEQQELLAQIQQLEMQFVTKLTKQARERFGNIKTANPQGYVQMMIALSQTFTNMESVNDEQFKEMLRQIQPKKRDIKITRK
jgi:programmed cell death protein 5